MGSKPLKATDRRRLKRTIPQVSDTDGAGPPLADIFNDRRRPNGQGKRPK